MALRVVIGVTAHNEGGNLGRLLERLRSAELTSGALHGVVVVLSGCTDDSVAIAERAASSDARIRVVVDPERRGKAAAINQLLAKARDADVIVMESADTLPEPGAIDRLVHTFSDPSVGMVGAHPIPDDDEATFLGYVTNLLWHLHDTIARTSPKQGELVAWRNVIERIPEDVAVDEAYLEAALTKAGYMLAYASDALVRNRGARTLHAFIAQRRRIHTGHRLLGSKYGYRPATRDHGRLVRLAIGELLRRPTRAHWLLGAAALELWCSVLGWWDATIAHRDQAVWPMVAGTKVLHAERSGGPPRVAGIIVTHRGRVNVLELLRSLERNQYPELRLIVIDNGPDGAGAAIHAHHPHVEVIRTPNDGLAAAFNVGMRAALRHDPDYVLQLNDDLVVASDHIERLVAEAERRPRAGAVGGPIYHYDDPERIWFAGGGIIWPLGKTYHRGREVLDGPAFQAAQRVAYACGAAVLYRTAALREIGGWDEDYFLVFEDSDWSVRAVRMGWEIWYVPGPKAWHKGSQSFGGAKSALYLYFLFRNNIRFMKKHARPWQWPTFIGFFLLESLLRYSAEALLSPDRATRLRAIWLGAVDGIRGRWGRGSFNTVSSWQALSEPSKATIT